MIDPKSFIPFSIDDVKYGYILTVNTIRSMSHTFRRSNTLITEKLNTETAQTPLATYMKYKVPGRRECEELEFK